jgi:hypothetical protein
MIPVAFIPLIVQVAGKLIDMAFSEIERQPAEKQSKLLDKIEQNDKKEWKKWEDKRHEK